MVAGAHDLTGVLLDGRYRVGEPIAAGGMSRVYRGLDTRLDRAVAIKIMDHRVAADPVFRGRLEREARAMARIEHPGVVAVHDHGEHRCGSPDGGDEGGPDLQGPTGGEPVVYLVMELVSGATLRDLLEERGRLDPPAALAVLEPVLAALAAAHQHGLAHRDVKPENVLISRSGTVKVTDFGLVTAAASNRATSTGVILGTPAYLAPEQVLGRDIGPRADVYAAGIVLFELLTGHPPFGGEHALSVAYQHVNTDVPEPSEFVPELAPELDGLVIRATHRAAEDRPPDAQTLLFAVRGVRSALGIPAVPVPVPARAGLGPSESQPTPVRPRSLTRVFTPADWPAADAARHAAADPTGEPVAEDLEPARRRDLRWPLVGVAAVVVLGVLAGVAGWALGGGSGVVTPAVIGLTEAAAQRQLTDAGLVAQVVERHNDRVAAGVVADSVPGGGTEVARGSSVTLTVSTGHPRVPVITPGTPVGTAQGLVRQAELTVDPGGPTRRHHPSAPVGTVIGTNPVAGTALTIGAPVTLVVSRGPDRESDREDDGSDSGLSNRIGDIIRRQLGELWGGN